MNNEVHLGFSGCQSIIRLEEKHWRREVLFSPPLETFSYKCKALRLVCLNMYYHPSDDLRFYSLIKGDSYREEKVGASV